MKTSTVFVSFLLLFFSSYSQNQALVDSLYHKIEKTNSDSLKIKLLNEISAHYLFTNTYGAKEPAIKALKLAEKTENDIGTMDALNRLGIMNYRLSQYDSALYFYKKGLAIADNLNDSVYLSKFSGNIASTYTSQAKYEDALKMYLERIRIQKIKDPAGVALSLLDIASIYFYLKDVEQALINAREAKKIAESFNDNRSLANAYNSIGTFLDELGKTDEALTNYKKSYQLKIKTGDKLGQSNTLINIAENYNSRKAYDKALAIYDSVLMIGKEIGATHQQANAYSNIGAIQTNLKQYEKADKSYKKAYGLYKEIGALEFIVQTAGKLGDNYIQLKDFEKASISFKEQSQLKDSLYKKNMTKDIAEMRTIYETEKKEQENLRLNKENELQELKLSIEKQNKKNLIWFFGISILFIVVLLLLLFNRFWLKKKSEVERQIAEQKRIGFEMVIEAEEKERIRIAKDLHDGLGQQISAVNIQFQMLSEKMAGSGVGLEPEMDKIRLMITDAGADVRSISHKMMPRALMEFGLIDALEDMIDKSFSSAKIACNFQHHNMDDRLPQHIEIGLYRIAQELINNILKHADAKNVEVQLVKKEKHCILVVQDNGKGIGHNGKNGIGIQNINSRLQVINGELNLESDAHSGTTAIVRVDLTKAYGNQTI